MKTILIMIIIGVLSTVFGKGKGNKQQPKNKPFSVNGLEEFRALFQNELTNQVPEKTEMAQPEQKKFQPPYLKNIEEEYLQTKQDVQTSQLEWNSQLNPVQPKKARADKYSDDKVMEVERLFSDKPDAKAVINGIIWSEILGEPRSKKPYNPRKS